MSPTYSVCSEHGYLKGEVWKCPICQKETEVYSRITGYYRPVKNWNAGKSQEFRDRKTYDLEVSNRHECASEEGHLSEEKPTVSVQEINELLLFTSPTCPNCKMAKMLLDREGIQYRQLDAYENKDEAVALGIVKAPTLLVPNGHGYDVYENASLIKGYIEKVKADGEA